MLAERIESWFEEATRKGVQKGLQDGIQKGRMEGEANLLARQLERRFGPLPQPVVERLAGWFNQINSTDDTRQFLARQAADAFPGSPESMAALIKTDIERWGRYAKLAKIEPQ